MSDIYEILSSEFKDRSDLLIIEVGAHIGSDTERLSRYAGKMICFEPDPRNVPLLRQKIASLSKDIVVVDAAVGAECAPGELILSSGTPPYQDNDIARTTQHTASSSLKRPKEHLVKFPWVKFDSSAKVNIVSMDKFMSSDGLEEKPIDILWMDVQGAELDVLSGAQEALRRTKLLYTEFSSDEMYEGQGTIDQIWAALPGEWGLVDIIGDNVLLQNKAFGTHLSHDSYAQKHWDDRYSEDEKNIQYASEMAKYLSEDIIRLAGASSICREFSSARSIIEFGCGLGFMAKKMKVRYPAKRILATDVSGKAIELAKHKQGEDEVLSFRAHDVRIPIQEKFDVAVACFLLQLFRRPFEVVDRMLEAAPSCVITVPYEQPVTDGYSDEGGQGHVYTFKTNTFSDRYEVRDIVINGTHGWKHSSKGEPPLQATYLLGKKP